MERSECSAPIPDKEDECGSDLVKTKNQQDCSMRNELSVFRKGVAMFGAFWFIVGIGYIVIQALRALENMAAK